MNEQMSKDSSKLIIDDLTNGDVLIISGGQLRLHSAQSVRDTRVTRDLRAGDSLTRFTCLRRISLTRRSLARIARSNFVGGA